jgi:hypothetical protein
MIVFRFVRVMVCRHIVVRFSSLSSYMMYASIV